MSLVIISKRSFAIDFLQLDSIKCGKSGIWKGGGKNDKIISKTKGFFYFARLLSVKIFSVNLAKGKKIIMPNDTNSKHQNLR